MKSIAAYLKSVSRLGLLLLIVGQAFIALPVNAQQSPTKAPVESIPPLIPLTPSLKPVPETPAKTTTPAPEAAAPALSTEQLQIRSLVAQGVFPPDAETRTIPFTRAEVASILVKALKHDTTLVSEFPFYRDVPLEHAFYVPIEVARAKKLLVFEQDQGFYRPETPAIYANVYRAIAQAITGPPPSTEATKHLLEHVVDKDLIPEDLAPAVAKMSRVRFFRPSSTDKTIALRPDEPVRADGLAPLVAGLMQLVEKRATLIEEDTLKPLLPEGMMLSITPATAILEVQLGVGETVNFSLMGRVPPLRRGTQLKGIVKESLPGQTYTVEIIEATTPEGETYQTSAYLVISFAGKGKLGFFVPGELFTVVTNTPGNANSVQPPPPESSPLVPVAPNSSPTRVPPPGSP